MKMAAGAAAAASTDPYERAASDIPMDIPGSATSRDRVVDDMPPRGDGSASRVSFQHRNRLCHNAIEMEVNKGT
eukprot:SAG31_NODE_31300_length_369_cov_1.903704_1_plen_74_part_01